MHSYGVNASCQHLEILLPMMLKGMEISHLNIYKIIYMLIVLSIKSKALAMAETGMSLACQGQLTKPVAMQGS